MPVYSRVGVDWSIEFDFDFDFTLPLNGRESQTCAHVRYRKVGTRRWTKFLLVADEGDTLQSLDAKIEPAIIAHSAGVA